MNEIDPLAPVDDGTRKEWAQTMRMVSYISTENEALTALNGIFAVLKPLDHDHRLAVIRSAKQILCAEAPF